MFIYAFEKDKKKHKQCSNFLRAKKTHKDTLIACTDVTIFLILKNPNVWKWKMERDQVSKTQSSKPKDGWNWKRYCKIALRDVLK